MQVRDQRLGVAALLLAPLALWGCGTTSTSPDLRPELATLMECTPDGVGEPPHQDITGAIYSVAVPVELEPYADYPIGDVSLCRLGDGLQLGYSLPKLLVGDKTRVQFAGGHVAASDSYELSSADGTASCVRVASAWTCTERFTGITVDLAEVAEEVEDLPPEEPEARLDVSEIFQGDPIGILDFTLP